MASKAEELLSDNVKLRTATTRSQVQILVAKARVAQASFEKASQAQVDTIVAVSGGLDDAGKTSARRFADERGMNLQHLTEAEADAVLAHLATLRPPDREASPAGAGAT